jgi:glycosyltransferase involved in cell wall biosynthesis
MARYGLTDDQRYVISVGSDEPRKNLSNVWRALRLVRGRFPEVVLLKVGRGYNPAARDELKRLAAQLRIQKAIRYFDEVPEHDLPLFYAAAELLVMPSLYEGFGLPALEAMASGIPVVVSDRAALPEVVGRDSGILVDPSDVAGLARAIVKLLEDRALAMRLGARGRARARLFTWEAMVNKTIDVYRRAIDSVLRQGKNPVAGG